MEVIGLSAMIDGGRTVLFIGWLGNRLAGENETELGKL
jgi:hypothetical protein